MSHGAMRSRSRYWKEKVNFRNLYPVEAMFLVLM